MSEYGHSPNQSESEIGDLGLTQERRKQTIATNIDLILRRCERVKVQPREMMLRSFEDKQAIDQRFGDFVDQALERIKILPDFDLDNSEEREMATVALQELYEELIQFNNPEGESQDVESREQWEKAGIFTYELGEQHELILHVPPMTESPQAQQMKDSLLELAAVVAKDSEIQEIRGSSLLLEHPLVKRFGFTIDKESDQGFNPNFRMSRAEFLKRFEEVEK